MKNFLIGLTSGFLLAGLTAVIFVFVFIRLAASLGERRPVIADGSTLVMRLEGAVPEKPPTAVPLPFLEDQAPASLPQLWNMFRRAATDPKIKAILFEPRGLTLGWAQMEEIRSEILQFKKSGKPVYAFLRNPGGAEYYLATAADRIYMTPEDSLDLKGLRIEAMYFKNTLDKIGVRMEVVHAGKYKDAFDTFAATGMSPETREVLNSVLDQFFGDLVTTIASGRKRQPDDIRALIDQGPFMAAQAQSAGLVDTLAFEDQTIDELSKRLGQKELKRVSHKTYLKSDPGSTGKRIAWIVGQGEILRGSGGALESEGIISGPFIKMLKDVENDSTIQGAIIRVDSPGGDGIASDDILHEARVLSQKKPVVISMGDLAASGGYFISMTGDPIVAYPNTLTGSIGVIYGRLNLHGLYDKLGIGVETLQRGRYADINSEYANLTPDEREKLTRQIDGFYQVFLQRVSQGRKRPVDQIAPIAEGHVWLGAQAKQNGLVDELGGVDRAVELIKQRAHIAPGESISLVTLPPKKTILDLLVSRSDDSTAIDVAARKLLGGRFPIESLRQGGFLKLMPYTISVH